MNQKYKYLMKNMGILTISNFASKILVFLLVPLYTSVLSTDEYGSYDLVVTTMSLLLPIVTLNISDAAMRFTLDKCRNNEDVATIGFRYVLYGIIIGTFLLIVNFFSGIVKLIHGYEGIIFIYFAFYLLNSFLTQLAKGMERVMDMGIAGIIGTLITVITNFVFLLVLRLGLTGFFVANILGCAGPVAYYFVRLKCWNYIGFQSVDRGLKKDMLNYCIPLILVAIGWIVNNSLDKYMVTAFESVAAAGLLAVAYKIPNILGLVQNIFTQAWQISAVSEFENKDSSEFYTSAFEMSSAFICICCSGLIILCRPLAKILYSKDFYEAWKYVPFLLASATFNMAGGFIGPLLSAKMNSKTMAKSAIYGILTNIIFNTLLILIMGVQGATIATAISSFVIFIVRKIAVKDMLDSSFNLYLYSSWTIMILLGCVEIWIGNYLIEIVLLIVLFIIYKQQISKLVSLIKSFFIKSCG